MILEKIIFRKGRLGFIQRLFCLTLTAFAFSAFPMLADAQLNLDATFNAGVTDGNAEVYVTSPLADGKILAGGNFLLVNGVEKTGLARLNADGSLDQTFNPNGAGPNNAVYEIVELTDGKILIGGNFTTYDGAAKSGIVRLNRDGTLDDAFNPGGAGTTGNVQTIALQPDGKILISGSELTAYNGVSRFSVVRLNADGTLDASFNSPFAGAQFVEEVDVQPDGKIVIGGKFVIGNPQRVDIARLNPNGSLDVSFNPSGGGGDGGGVYAVTIQPNGKILIGGGFYSYNREKRTAIARINSDGSLDASFNPNVGIGINGGEYFAVQPDGKILIAGGFGSITANNSLIRLNADGSLDNSFAFNRADNTGYHVSLQTDGKILLGGYFTVFNNQSRRNLLRLNPDGTLDNSFNASFGTFATINALAQQANGKTVVAGNFNQAGGVSRAKLARFNSDGSLDTTFNAGTGISPDSANALNTINDIAVQTDGKIIVAGCFAGYNGAFRRSVARLNADGSLDWSFEVSDFYNLFVSTVYDVSIQPDGKILLGGSFIGENGSRFLIRLNPNGTVDSGFTGGANNTVRSIARQPDGKLIIGGIFTSYSGQSRARIARLNSDGSLDETFHPGAGFDGTVLDLALQPDAKILVAGTFTAANGTARNRIARLNADGSPDASFDPGSGAENTVSAITLQNDGKIIVGGSFSTINGIASNRLARLNADGSYDASFASRFDNDGRFAVRRVLLQTDGKLLVGGIFKTYNSVARNSLLKLSASSAPRSTQFDFDGDGRADASVYRQGIWYLLRSTAGFTGVQFGAASDKLVPADYDGDGKTEVAVFRDGNWYYLRSSDGVFRAIQFGQAGDTPVPADYDADGKADIAVFRQGNWYLLLSATNQFRAVQFGAANDKPVQADYDADGKTDVAVYRNGFWYWLNSSTNEFRAVQFGAANDVPVVGDYDGDGRADQAVYRAGTWYLLRSTTGFAGIQFGNSTDILVAADYDGDGKTDMAVFRDGNWFRINSANNQFQAVQFGNSTDKPVPAAFLP